jgi:site-specific DNA-methyltransferase (adenine-specific)
MTFREERIGRARLILGDCRDVLPTLGKVNAVVTDPPYGTTRARWDAVIPFDEMWAAVSTVTGPNSPVVLFGSEPFSSLLRCSNLKQFRYDWIWHKPKATGFLNAKRQPLRGHETISVFSEGAAIYYPQKSQGHPRKTTFRNRNLQTNVYGNMKDDYRYDSTERYPHSVLSFSSDTQNTSEHDTQKPVALMAYLVSTYSSPNEIVLDFTMGSGTTGVACALQGRRFIGVEIDPVFFDIACRRIEEAQKQGDLFVEPAA